MEMNALQTVERDLDAAQTELKTATEAASQVIVLKLRIKGLEAAKRCLTQPTRVDVGVSRKKKEGKA